MNSQTLLLGSHAKPVKTQIQRQAYARVIEGDENECLTSDITPSARTIRLMFFRAFRVFRGH